MIRLLSLLFLAAAPVAATSACTASPPQVARDVAQAASLAIGYVVGERLPDYEAALTNPSGPVSTASGRRLVRVVPTEALRGSLPAPVEISVPCAIPYPRLRERVVVAILPDGQASVVSAALFPKYEKALRVAVAAGR